MVAAYHQQVLRNVTELIFEGGAAAAAGAGACCATTRKSCAATFEHFFVSSVQNQYFFPWEKRLVLDTFLDAILLIRSYLPFGTKKKIDRY